jgi:hypothetical protein
MNNEIRTALAFLDSMDERFMRDYSNAYIASINILLRNLTGFKNLDEIKNSGGRYRPSMNVTDKVYGTAFTFIADAYDRTMESMGDDRRAFRF